MNLLLTNDDGITAPGLAALEQAVRELGNVVTVAPDQHLSGCSHQVNAARPLNLSLVEEGRFALDGTPADCTRIGLKHLHVEADWVLSGVNDGGNLGVDVFMSGTVAAVREAAWHHVRGIAFSQYRKSRMEFHWPGVVPLVHRVLLELWQLPLEPGAFWNVNLPDLQADGQPAVHFNEVEIVHCPLNRHPLPTQFDVQENAYHYRGVYGDRHRDAGTDVDVCFSGKVAVTKILPHYAG
jgi:5'-nucleotidase